jgi:putative phosphoribosyl transferase
MWQSRVEAGQQLAQKLGEIPQQELPRESLIILGIPRGGVIVGHQVATLLRSPLDVVVTKKIGAPGNSELAIGAVGALGEPVIDEELAKRVGADETYLQRQITELRSEVLRRVKEYRGDKPTPDLKNKVVVITDDGVATGATIKAAIEILRQENPQKIIVAVPVISKEALREIEALADEVVYLEAPELFFAVGQFYQEFEQITDEEVKELLGETAF